MGPARIYLALKICWSPSRLGALSGPAESAI